MILEIDPTQTTKPEPIYMWPDLDVPEEEKKEETLDEILGLINLPVYYAPIHVAR